MPAASEKYTGPGKLIILAPGESRQGDDRVFARTRSTWAVIPAGYESTETAALRLGNTRWGIRKLCIAGRLEHLRKGTGKRCRLFIKQGAMPRRKP